MESSAWERWPVRDRVPNCGRIVLWIGSESLWVKVRVVGWNLWRASRDFSVFQVLWVSIVHITRGPKRHRGPCPEYSGAWARWLIEWMLWSDWNEVRIGWSIDWRLKLVRMIRWEWRKSSGLLDSVVNGGDVTVALLFDNGVSRGGPSAEEVHIVLAADRNLSVAAERGDSVVNHRNI